MQHRVLLILLGAFITKATCESASNSTEEAEVAPIKLNSYGNAYASAQHPNTYTTQDAAHTVYPQTHKTVPASLTYPEQTVQVNQRTTQNVVHNPVTGSKTTHVPYGQTTYTRTDQAQTLATTDQLITQTTNPFQTKTTIGTPVTEATTINQPVSDQTVTTRNFPTQHYRPDPNAPQPYHDPNIYNLPNYENVPTSFAVGGNLNAGVGIAPPGYQGQPGTYLNSHHGNPSVYATGYGNAGYGYGNGNYAHGIGYSPGYTSHASYNGLFLKQQDDVNTSGKLTGGAIAGIIAGGVCFLALCIGGVCCMFRQNKFQNGENGDLEMNGVDATAEGLPQITHDTEGYSKRNQSLSMHSMQDESAYNQAQPKEQQL